ncbi:hypothetical protein A2526_00950 [candidate division WOR-1 bacterium RIFOXYD2_FULL_36_8]|uniref:SpoVT-AbrB domain-containing protein n=1 Tax=candidate division WOR-1 bacterium RIFOXYB2_FULL_36_35 TaxID=1802578 RepID=A0A1F4S2C6_UNCSA|nr:MAG: hypothetical protein A2230_06190 [candidate division WOR-1 bacterium RIFOXYA2_FULL_36_21]OGC14560.1 MAG: hypothetical protein A2290_01770 [candidate division WOR-1 bacterium RIFOXYB2_FULL_36_35]OGC16232.1 MAG: hypothetical protein A2282_01325 [candidate division WOR-1 bacterium RIFOXYA12_FULL_36_13]OGC38699.1 MAG: hypothetical protein A2526_00950 [candidate division WOR-1 bacterium RIFOXYD2_FULL_36_8]
MTKDEIAKNCLIEIPTDTLKKMPLKTGDILRVKLINGNEVVLEKPKQDYWDEIFFWGKNFAKTKKIKKKNIQEAINEIRSPKR